MTVLKEFGHKSWGLDVAGEVFIETGTGKGDSLLNAIHFSNEENKRWNPSFRDFHSIEVNLDYVLEASEKVDRIRGNKQVTIHHGSSVDVLPKIIDPTKKTVFWLDAHWEGPEYWEPMHGQCPLLDELKIILSFQWLVKPVILIDDYAIFMSEGKWWDKYCGGHDPNEWPLWGRIYDLMGGVDYKWNFLAANDGILYCW